MNQILLDFISNHLTTQLNREIRLTHWESVGGGCINACYKIYNKADKFFVKLNSSSKYPGMFKTEKLGLKQLQDTQTLKVPAVLAELEVNDQSILIMEHIDSGVKNKNFWSLFGEGLAGLHSSTAQDFGLEHNNYIGSLIQCNDQRKTWFEFFAEMRIEPQLQIARDSGKISRHFNSTFSRLISNIEDLFPTEQPSLLHGDLWSGNFMVNQEGNPCIMDPAVYYGHREMDLAMTRLFGGFDPIFYKSYNQKKPLEIGWEKRTEIANLYPLLVHVNLFGEGYVSQVESIVRRWV